MKVEGDRCWSELEHKIKFIKKNKSVEYSEKNTIIRITINCKVR